MTSGSVMESEASS